MISIVLELSLLQLTGILILECGHKRMPADEKNEYRLPVLYT